MKRFPLVLPKTRKKQSKTKQSKSKSIIYCLSIDVKLRYFFTAKLKLHSILEFVGQTVEQIVILESSTGGTAVAVNKGDDTVFVKV